ncbi:acetyl-CoA C-acetyltransferase [Cellulomonas carbonis]|uniref:Acetyl-CoA acetyltransferase n=1 Tax=Cellulomonas carbonis T26 TaxID=947969 RepID=A0A0A0BVE7_9CELL|nr:acetyl-CoA C-acetyltransferase [Cellulomonas carbonis]KGM12358.1 acetyl-CoA acetyltransferase [Cellulomonas carbonis T26]GGC03604.1 acetyl-CoA acetyltransferase [Cellulomonas carbonis]
MAAPRTSPTPAPAPATTGTGAGAGTTRRAVVVGGNRIPFARAGGPYAHSSNQDMLTAALEGLVARFGLAGERIGEVAAGAVLKHSRDFNLTRESVLGSALSPETPAYDVQMACATGMETVLGLSNKIRLGQIDSAVAGGVDSTSDAPIAVSEPLRRVLLDLSRAKTPQQRLKAVSRLRPAHLAPSAPTTGEPRTGLSMGEHQALTTAAWGITREAQDELAVASHHRLAAAYERGFFDDLMTPYRRLTRDANLRADTSVEKLAGLKPVFGKSLDAPATMTAGNSTPLSDGASTVLLASDEWAAERGLPVLATIVDAEPGAVDFVHGRDGLLMAGAHAVPRLLARNGLTLQDFDLYEIHEAFAGTVLCNLAAWEDEDFCRERLGLDKALGSVDRSRLNVTGSSLAAGHPFAATGGRIVATLAKLLAEKGPGSRGLISVCAAGGQAITMIMEAA